MSDDGSAPSRPIRPSRGGDGGGREIPRPELPEDEEPQLPKGITAQIRSAAGKDETDDVALALSLGSAALEEGRPDVALDYLPWARSRAGRAPAVREALGVARYLDGDFDAALSELRAYRRMSGRADQNHLIADCLRAQGRDIDEVAGDIEAMLADAAVAAGRRLEGVIVWAGAVADDGDVDGARRIMRRADDVVHDLDTSGEDIPDALLRVWYVEGDLADRAGEDDVARRYFRRVVDEAGEVFDAAERLRALGGTD